MARKQIDFKDTGAFWELQIWILLADNTVSSFEGLKSIDLLFAQGPV